MTDRKTKDREFFGVGYADGISGKDKNENLKAGFKWAYAQGYGRAMRDREYKVDRTVNEAWASFLISESGG